jgi:hypothetical protein
VTGVLAPLRAVRAAPEHAVTVSWFYATTDAQYNLWPKNDYRVNPDQTTWFPAGTRVVAFFFAYSGAGKTSGCYIVLRKHAGPTVDVLGWYRLATGSNRETMMRLAAADWRAYPNGSYFADLVIDDHLMGTIPFTIGGKATGLDGAKA